MKKGILISSLFSLSAFATNVTTTHFFSNNEFHTRDEISTDINIPLEKLSAYSCQANEPFASPLLNPAAKRDSLRIIDKGEEIIFSLDDETQSASSSFAKKTLDTLKEIAQTKSGKKLLESLTKAPHIIKIGPGLNRFDARFNGRGSLGLNHATMFMALAVNRYNVDRLPTQQLGSEGVVFWTPDQKTKFLEEDDVLRYNTNAMTLAHELFHAFDSVRGLLDRRHVTQEGYEFVEITEYRAVYFENLIRKELGRKYRKKYSADSKGSMLDGDNEPRWIIPTCLETHEEGPR